MSEQEKQEGRDKEQEGPTLQQTCVAICGLFMNEVQEANKKYPSFFRSSKEALGVLREEYLEVEELLRMSKTADGYALDQSSLEVQAELKKELIQLGAMCIKALYSSCNLNAECAAFSEVIRLQALAEQQEIDSQDGKEDGAAPACEEPEETTD